MGGRASGVARSGKLLILFRFVPFRSVSPIRRGPGRAVLREWSRPDLRGRGAYAVVKVPRTRERRRTGHALQAAVRRLQRTSVAGSAAIALVAVVVGWGSPNHCGGSAPWRRCGSTVIRSALLTNVTRTLGSPHQPPRKEPPEGLAREERRYAVVLLRFLEAVAGSAFLNLIFR